jgi:tetratricopeptide (TPR) repeat protein
MITRFSRLPVLVTALLLLPYGCSSDNEPDSGLGPKLDIDKAWNAFANGAYKQAAAIFEALLNTDDSDYEALLGLGWCLAFLGQHSEAETRLLDASEAETTRIDAHMGLATVYRDLPNYDRAVFYCEQVLLEDSLYVFARKPLIDFLDAHLIIAQVSFRKGPQSYDRVHEELDFLLRNLGRPELPPRGQQQDSEYEATLLEQLEVVTELIS